MRWRSKASGTFSRRILGMRNGAVKAADHLVFQAFGFSRIFRGNHFFAKSSEFFAGELAGRQVETHEIANFLPFLRGKAFDLFDDFSRAHEEKLMGLGRMCNLEYSGIQAEEP